MTPEDGDVEGAPQAQLGAAAMSRLTAALVAGRRRGGLSDAAAAC